jgi:hypothetical protein
MSLKSWPAVAIGFVLMALASGCASKRTSQTAPPPIAATASPTVRAPVAAGPQCDSNLWDHVYAGDPRQFKSAKDRLQVIQDCITVTGTIKKAKAEPDGDFHITVEVDPEFKHLLNDKNTAGQHGFLVVEPICSNRVKQPDTLKEGVCKGFNQSIYKNNMKGKRVRITGAYVTDMEHGWNEIHPVTSIVLF